MNPKKPLSASARIAFKLKVLAKEKENVRRKLVVTAKKLRIKAQELAVTAKEKERVRRTLLVTAKKLRHKAAELATAAKEKENVRRKLTVLAKEKEAVRRTLLVTARKLNMSRKTLEKKVRERTKDLEQVRAKDEAILASIGSIERGMGASSRRERSSTARTLSRRR